MTILQHYNSAGELENGGVIFGIGSAAQPHNRKVDGITTTVIGTILFPPGVYAYKVHIDGGAAGDKILVTEDATPVNALDIASVTIGNPTTITTKTDHNLQAGSLIHIRNSSGGSVDINGQYTATVTGTDTFTIPVDTSAATGTYINGNVIDLTQANNWLTPISPIDPDIDVQASEFYQRAKSDNEGWSEWKQFDASSEGLRRLDFKSDSAAGPFTIHVETA